MLLFSVIIHTQSALGPSETGDITWPFRLFGAVPIFSGPPKGAGIGGAPADGFQGLAQRRQVFYPRAAAFEADFLLCEAERLDGWRYEYLCAINL